MFDINKLRSLGPNGYQVGFYQQYWDIVGEDVIKYVMVFLEGKVILDEINKTNVVLILKNAYLVSPDHYYIK